MNKPKGVRCIDAAVQRLRNACQHRALRDADGRITQEGYPTPYEIEVELIRIYQLGMRAGIKRGKWSGK